MDSIFGFQSMIVVVRSLFAKSFLHVIVESLFFQPLCSRIRSSSVRDRQIQTYQQLRYLGCQRWEKVLVPVCCQVAGLK